MGKQMKQSCLGHPSTQKCTSMRDSIGPPILIAIQNHLKKIVLYLGSCLFSPTFFFNSSVDVHPTRQLLSYL